MAENNGDAERVLGRLFETIRARRSADPETSYVAKRLHQGTGRIAQKVGEEAVETVVAAMSGDRQAVVSESADLLFHLMILWADAGLRPADVMAELVRREGMSGLAEKRDRPEPES